MNLFSVSEEWPLTPKGINIDEEKNKVSGKPWLFGWQCWLCLPRTEEDGVCPWRRPPAPKQSPQHPEARKAFVPEVLLLSPLQHCAHGHHCLLTPTQIRGHASSWKRLGQGRTQGPCILVVWSLTKTQEGRGRSRRGGVGITRK